MKPYLTDVPVKVMIWIRPELQRKQFQVIKKAKPSILFLQSDGGRNEKEWEAIKQNRRMFDEEIDWECQVHRLYEEKNLGMYTMGRKANEYLFERVDRCVVLEDDEIPSVDFFRFCKEMLDRYENDLRIHCICGVNHLGVHNKCSSDYFFSRQGAVGGIAYWKRSRGIIDDFSYGKDGYAKSLLKQSAKKNKWFLREAFNYSNNKSYEGHNPGREFSMNFGVYAQNQLLIIPKHNLISNMGATADSAHGDELEHLPAGIRRVYNMKAHRLHFPLKHPEYVIADEWYEKKRNDILAYNRPVRNAFRKLERGILTLRHKGVGETLRKVENAVHRDVET